MRKDCIIDRKYKIVDVLGKGGMSTVYLAENIKLGTLWAIKEISRISSSKIDLLAEPNILKKLNHPALPKIIDIIESEESIYIIVDYIEGNTLDVELGKKGCIPENVALDWAKQLCGVLIYLHGFMPNPIIYRDMKPSNIILTKEGLIKLIDFGTAREYKEYSDTDTVYLGTRGYAAPEQFGLGQSNITTDIYSLGITLFHLVTGINPNAVSGEIESIRGLNPELSRELEEIICKCVRYDAVERYQSVNELMADICKTEDCKSENSHRNSTASIPCNYEKVEQPRVIRFRKLILSFTGNGEFASSFAYLSSKLSNYKVALIDLDSLSPMCDYYLRVNSSALSKQVGSREVECGVNLVLEGMRNNCSLSHDEIIRFAVKRKEAENLYIFTGSRQWEKYGKFSSDEVRKLIDLMYRSFDLTILVLNDSVKEPYTVAAVNNCDYIIAAQRPYSDEICRSQRIMEFFCEEYGIAREKIKYVMYDAKPTGHEEKFIRNEGFGLGDSLIGSIRHTEKYERYRNKKALYMKCADSEVIKDYRKLLAVFNIVPKISLSEILSSKLKGLGNTIKRALAAK